MQKNIVIILLCSIGIAVFAILNAGAVPVNLIFTKVNVSAALVILISASLGAIIVYFLDTVSRMKSKKSKKEFEKMLLKMTNENQQLKEQIEDLNAELIECQVNLKNSVKKASGKKELIKEVEGTNQ
ncbi:MULTISPECIES: lipopolysaccharide assembly protein LapA domain-containing protein [unclassified Fusibacter]|uniref:lipopolysaccharide assembly protein LapA domain-containing protein n=1 Tax=unclassified Fusibacter TaxID=2624464 RepID=UPI0010104FEF|nr:MULTISPECIES: LapA family protein [unclassified Fusibacter]MCK8058524.1 LapA family protein [Fusibacter sp. A2]NPE22707.1 LapA family protein [Fusibacter sp. A1]RXV60267.1 LapA family protein [Fusibacter sp. A1]